MDAFKCPLCPRTFARRRYLVKHVEHLQRALFAGETYVCRPSRRTKPLLLD